MPSYEFWVSFITSTAIGSYTAYLQRKQLLHSMNTAAIPTKTAKTTSLWSYKSVLIVLVLMAAAWMPYLLTVWTEKSNSALWYSLPKERVERQTFSNTTVELDGKSFEHCQFSNVTLVYRGVAPVAFIESKFSGTIFLATTNPSVTNFAMLRDKLLTYPGVTKFFSGHQDDKGNIHPFTPPQTIPIPKQ